MSVKILNSLSRVGEAESTNAGYRWIGEGAGLNSPFQSKALNRTCWCRLPVNFKILKNARDGQICIGADLQFGGSVKII